METSYKTLIDAKEIIERAYHEAEGLTNITPEDFPILVEWIVQKCNMVKIPIPHGDLVDREWLIGVAKLNKDIYTEAIVDLDDLWNAPTVIESE